MQILAWLIVALLALPVLMFAVECLSGLGASSPSTAVPVPPPFAVLMPAHDEAAGIAVAIAAVQAQLRPIDRLLVVADNCTDATAAIARSLGAIVVERTSANERGKGFALAAGRAALAAEPPGVVIVLDADCVPGPSALSRLAAEAARRDAAIQGCYLLTAENSAAAATQVSNFAFLVKNLVRQRGMQRLGLPALLQGSGMAFPWPLFANARLASTSIVEDLELGLELVLACGDVGFLADARFTSAASRGDATIAQRTRWEHGTVGTGWRYAPLLIAAGLRGRPSLIALAIDVVIPPLALLAALQIAALVVQAGLAVLGYGLAPLLAQLGVSALFAVAVVASWHFAGRGALAPATLVQVPAYVIWKLPIYLRLLVDRERAWIRTRRDV